MLTERTGYKLDILPDGKILVHTMTYVSRDGVEIAQVYGAHRILEPGELDAAKVVMPDAPIKAIAEAVWTPEVKVAYAAKVMAAKAIDIQIAPTGERIETIEKLAPVSNEDNAVASPDSVVTMDAEKMVTP